jgi:hypothetical protein
MLYQLDLVTPGISPDRARFRKQMRQSMNFRYTPRERPQRRQRLCARTLNFGTHLAFALKQFFATLTPHQAAHCL